MKKFSFLGVLVLMLATAGFASAQTSKSSTVTLNPVGGSNVTGTATLTDAGNGNINVSVTFKGFAASSAHAGHIHKGSCENNGPVVYPLTSVTADASGNGTSTSSVKASYAEVTSGQYYVNFHVADSPPGGGITCGNIVANAPATGGSATGTGSTSSAPTSAPATGLGGFGSSQDNFNLLALGGLATLLVGSAAAYGTLRRRGHR